ncbi:MAG: FecR domain-containing protein [Candidatus Gracilibacteria bacterium]
MIYEMLKIKNKFIIFIILIIVLVIFTGVLKSFYEKNIDRDSYVLLLKGKAILNDSLLKLNNKQKVYTGDSVRTVGKTALAVVEWGDGSVTRLGGDTSIKIDELYVSDDAGKINIGFRLLNGKSWSNVVSFFGKDSYFKEYFRDSEAAVRGTIFNLDLNLNYLHVIDHKVEVSNSGKIIVVDQNKPFNIRTFNFIALENFIKTLRDDAWESINSKIDIEFFEGLKTQLNNDIDKLNSFRDIKISEVLVDSEKREELYNELLSDYQKLNFIKSENIELFKTKLEIKDILIKLANNENKNILINSTLYDLKDTIQKKEYSSISAITSILADNKDVIGNIDFREYFKGDFVSEDLKTILKDDLSNLKNIFGDTFIDWMNIDFSFGNIKEKGDEIIHNTLDSGIEAIENLINK